VRRARTLACLAPAAFALLAAVLAGLAEVSALEAGWATASVLLAFVPSALLAPAGWRRHAAELALLPPAYVLAMLADPTQRRMALPPLLLLAALAAASAALARATPALHPLLLVSLALAVRSAAGLGLAGVGAAAQLVVVLATATLAWAAARALGRSAGVLAALLAGALPLQHAPLAAAVLAAIALVTAMWGRIPALGERGFRGWLSGALAVSLLLVSLGAWGDLPISRMFPSAGWLAGAATVAALVATPFLPAAAAGAVWTAATLTLGPPQPAPPDRAGFVLAAVEGETTLPASQGGPYVLDLALANGSQVASGTPVAALRYGGQVVTLRAGIDTAEWAHERPDVLRHVAHPLPRRPVWRPGGVGAHALWGVGGRTVLRIPAGVAPVLQRDPSLPARVTLSVATAGPSRPSPPRNWPLPAWLLAAALAVAVVQAASGTWRSPAAVLPWGLLAALSLVARAPVEPLRLVGERYGVDVALAAFLAAWLPAARAWFAGRRLLRAAVVPLAALAIATPHLTPPLYGDEPFHLVVLDSLAHDHDLDLSNNLDLEHHPYNRIYVSGKIFLHSPALAMLLLPGYLLLGRTGALLLLSLAGSAVVVLLLRRAGQIGVARSRLAVLGALLILTYPLATFSTQIWVEVVGALAAVASLLLLTYAPPRRGSVAILAALATAVKTRLALVTFPLALAAWRPRGRATRKLVGATLVLLAAAAAGLAVGWLFLGDPFNGRRFAMFVPRSLRQPAIVLGGLLFDGAGGLAFSGPLLLAALAGVAALWRRGGDGERALLLGGAATVLALLNSPEWYGGGAPPARYLVPLLPAFALAGAMLLKGGWRGRSLVAVLVPPALLSWWVLVTRPHFSVNPGDGGYWLADALARRFQAGAWHLFPSFLVPRPATVVVPAVIVLASAAAVLAARRRPAFARTLARASVAVWLLAGTALIITLVLREDRVVEIEEPQVAHLGGHPEPPEGTFSRYTHPNGWRIGAGDAVEVPMRLAADARADLQGWFEGPPGRPGRLRASWDGGASHEFLLPPGAHGSLLLPAPPGRGRQRLRLELLPPSAGEAVLDRVVVAQ
jgi:hypothetical protein